MQYSHFLVYTCCGEVKGLFVRSPLGGRWLVHFPSALLSLSLSLSLLSVALERRSVAGKGNQLIPEDDKNTFKTEEGKGTKTSKVTASLRQKSAYHKQQCSIDLAFISTSPT